MAPEIGSSIYTLPSERDAINKELSAEISQ
jgi:hypothetical protein